MSVRKYWFYNIFLNYWVTGSTPVSSSLKNLENQGSLFFALHFILHFYLRLSTRYNLLCRRAVIVFYYFNDKFIVENLFLNTKRFNWVLGHDIYNSDDLKIKTVWSNCFVQTVWLYFCIIFLITLHGLP